MDMVSLLLHFVRTSREGNWADHLVCIGEMLPWMFSYDRTHYSRYLSLYWCQMHCLQSTHPVVYKQLMSGEFCVQRSFNAFTQVAIDHAIEQTIDGNSKTKGDIIGFSKMQELSINCLSMLISKQRLLRVAGI